MGKLFVTIYCLPLWHTAALVAIAGFCWRWACRWYLRAERKNRCFALIAAVLLLFVWSTGIFWQTVLSRESGMHEANWQLFAQLKAYLNGGDKELIRTGWMNALLFVPGGVLLTAVLPKGWNPCVRAVLVFILLGGFSTGIELLQFQYALGVAEADDIFCNAMGAAVGILIQELCWRWAVQHPVPTDKTE